MGWCGVRGEAGETKREYRKSSTASTVSIFVALTIKFTKSETSLLALSLNLAADQSVTQVHVTSLSHSLSLSLADNFFFCHF